LIQQIELKPEMDRLQFELQSEFLRNLVLCVIEIKAQTGQEQLQG